MAYLFVKEIPTGFSLLDFSGLATNLESVPGGGFKFQAIAGMVPTEITVSVGSRKAVKAPSFAEPDSQGYAIPVPQRFIQS